MPTGMPGQGPVRRRAPRRQRSASDPTRYDNNEPNPPSTQGEAGSLTRHLTDPAIEIAIEEFVATAPPLPEDVRSRLARLLRTNHYRGDLGSDEQAA